MNYWLVKSEPETFSWQQLVADGKTMWDGVRNYQARNFLKIMKAGEEVLFYHSNTGKEVMGIARIIKEAYPDPTSKVGDWVAVDIAPVKAFSRFVKLSEIKAEAQLKNILLLRQSRLSVMPIEKSEFELICRLGFKND